SSPVSINIPRFNSGTIRPSRRSRLGDTQDQEDDGSGGHQTSLHRIPAAWLRRARTQTPSPPGYEGRAESVSSSRWTLSSRDYNRVAVRDRTRAVPGSAATPPGTPLTARLVARRRGRTG